MYKYPDETWDRLGLSMNKGITIDLIHNLALPHATNEWYWFYISQNIPISDVYKYPNETWNRRGLSDNKGITIDIIHHLVLPRSIGSWKYTPIIDVYRYSNRVWSRYILSKNKDIRIDDIYRLDSKMRHDYRRYTTSFSDIIII